MNNSFYYFFSATPQVLASILALFSVFVIFKIQNIKSELFVIGQAIYDDTSRIIHSETEFDQLSDNEGTALTLERIKKALANKDIKSLTAIFESIKRRGNYDPYSSSYFEYYNSLKTLLRQTFYWSLFTGFIIFLCLSLIPFGHLVLMHPCIIYFIFIITIFFIFISLLGVILILKKSLSDPI